MKTKVLFVSSLFLLPHSFAKADPLYAENFDAAISYVEAKGPDQNNMSSVSYGVPGAGAPQLAPGQYGGTSQYFSNVEKKGSIDGGALAMGTPFRFMKSRGVEAT